LSWTSRSPEATRAAARELARSLGPRGLVIALVGPVGAGKTVFVRGLAEGLGVDPGEVASPTFAIASEHRAAGGLRLAHVDLYRIERETELEGAGLRDLFAPGVVLAVEWADRFPAALPPDRLEVRLAAPRGGPATHREISAVALGPVAAEALARWSAALAGRGRRLRGRRGAGGSRAR
jgi:tRNA threonylcarbamoyladenosine biosynthesis protein TsaE